MYKVLIVLAVLCSTAAYGHEQSRFYDAHGNSMGTATRDSQGTTTYRDQHGNITGKEYRK